MTASPGATYGHDVVGNRLSKSAGSASATYTWDAVNRMTGYQVASQSLNYQYVYRADGMRVRAEKGTQVDPWVTRTYYDGQMPIEEDTHSQANPGLVVTQNFLGARGLEAMTTKVGSNAPTTSYPLYDVHGNMVATVAKGSSGTSWTIQDERSYDVWGSVRSGAATGGPRGRYCASLGHVQDDESGLVYMRARYYEPGSGRFISQDPAMDGKNWFVYCNSMPTILVDETGEKGSWATILCRVVGVSITGALFYMLTQAGLFKEGLAAAIIMQIVQEFAFNSQVIGAFALEKLFIAKDFALSMIGKFVSYLKTLAEISKRRNLPPGTGNFMMLVAAYEGVLYAEMIIQENE